MKALVLRHREWDKIFAQVKQDYADTPSVYLIQSRMQRDLGWSYREHSDWKQYTNDVEYFTGDYRDSTSRIHIDFYTESARTFFLLKYMNNDQS